MSPTLTSTIEIEIPPAWIYIFIARYRATRPVANIYICDIVWYVHRKCISGENIDIVLSDVPRKYGILAGYKIVMNQCSVCMRFINPCHSGFALVSR